MESSSQGSNLGPLHRELEGLATRLLGKSPKSLLNTESHHVCYQNASSFEDNSFERYWKVLEHVLFITTEVA